MNRPRPSTGTRMIDARRRSGRNGFAWALHVAVITASAGAAMGAAVNTREAALIPTVHPTIVPSSAIPVPLLVRGDQTSVWKSDLEQRMLVAGHVVIDI